MRPATSPLATAAFTAALADAGIDADRVDHLVLASTHARAAKGTLKQLGVDGAKVTDDLAATVGNPGAAQPGLLLASALDRATPGQVVVLLSLADGADALVFRTTQAIAGYDSQPSVADQVAVGGPLPYGKFLAWRGMLTPEPPRRPEPARPSASAAARNEDWKYGFVGARDRTSGAIHLPPSRVSMTGGAVDDMEPVPMADVGGTVVTFTVDKLVYSPSPPVVFAIGRLRRRRPGAGGAHRRRPRRCGHRRAGGDDLPPPVHGRWHPQLLLEGSPRAPHLHLHPPTPPRTGRRDGRNRDH